MVDTKAVSVRLPLDLLNELNSYATDKGMVSGGDANIGGAIIALLREHFGQSDSVKQASDNVDIEGIVNNAVESRLDAVLNQVRDFELKLHSLTTDKLITENLQANLTVAQQKIEALEATVSGKKSHLQIAREKVLAA